MPFEWFVAVRFLREGRSQSLLILLGATVGVAVIVFLSELIGGLQERLIIQTLGSQAHIVVRAPEESARVLSADENIAARIEKAPQRVQTIQQWQQVLAQFDQWPGVVKASGTVAGSAFATRGPASRSIALRGVDPERFSDVIEIRSKVKEGAYRLGGRDVLIGTELARDLGATVGDKIRIATAEGRAELFEVAGIFDLGNKDVNTRWVLIAIRPAQTLLDLAGGISTIELKIDRVFDAEKRAQDIAARTGLVAESWMQTNAQLLVALRSQESSKSMIQFFVVIAVALGIASVLIVSVVQKSREVGILKAMGTSTGQIQRVFLTQGAIVGVAGAIGGSLLGTGLILFFDSIARQADGTPLFIVTLAPSLYLGASLVAIITGLVSAVGPARRAAKLDPAEVIRYG